MGISYSVEVDGEITSKAMGREIPMSMKDAVELCRELRDESYDDALEILDGVIGKKKPIALKKHNSKAGHRSQVKGWDAGGYPERVARELKKVLENAAGNAEFQGLEPGDMYVRHMAAHKVGESRGMRPRAFGSAGKWNRPLVDVEVILELTDDAVEEKEAEDDEVEETREEVTETEEPGPQDLTDIESVSEAKADSLREHGYESVEDVKAASKEDLMEVSGIGKAIAARIKADVGGLDVTMDDDEAEIDESAEEPEPGEDEVDGGGEEEEDDEDSEDSEPADTEDTDDEDSDEVETMDEIEEEPGQGEQDESEEAEIDLEDDEEEPEEADEDVEEKVEPEPDEDSEEETVDEEPETEDTDEQTEEPDNETDEIDEAEQGNGDEDEE